MSKKVRCYHTTREVIDTIKNEKHTILVYGELVQTNVAKGFVLAPVTYNKRNHREISSIDDRYVVLSRNQDLRPTRQFNFGWAICDANDEFDLETGIRIAKRRFSDSPMTTTDVRFFSDDMIRCILENEADFIEKNLEVKYLPSNFATTDTTDSAEEPELDGSEPELDFVLTNKNDTPDESSKQKKDTCTLNKVIENIVNQEVIKLKNKHNTTVNLDKVHLDRIKEVIGRELEKEISKSATNETVEEFPTVEFEAHKETKSFKHGDFIKFTNGRAFMYGVVRDSGISINSISPYVNLYWVLTRVEDGWVFRTNETIDTREIEFLTPRNYEDDLTYKVLYEVFGVIWDKNRKSIKLKSF